MRDAAVDHLQLYLKLAKEAWINGEILGKLISSFDVDDYTRPAMLDVWCYKISGLHGSYDRSITFSIT